MRRTSEERLTSIGEISQNWTMGGSGRPSLAWLIGSVGIQREVIGAEGCNSYMPSVRKGGYFVISANDVFNVQSMFAHAF